MAELAEIHEMMRRHSVRESDIERVAGFGRCFMRQLRTGRRSLSEPVAQRIRLAISRIQRGDRHHDGQAAAAAFRMAVAIVADKFGTSPQLVLESDPSKRATADPAWLQAAKLRRIALYIANIYLAIPQAELARAAGMSKAAVSIAMNDIEDLREQPELEGILRSIEEAFA